jgi:hypothetical protein
MRHYARTKLPDLPADGIIVGTTARLSDGASGFLREDGVTEQNAEERRELELAGWESRGEGSKAIWRRPEGGRWYARYQALAALRKEREDERLGTSENPPTPGGGAA